MFAHRVLSTHGRLIPKPQDPKKEVIVIDEVIPIQDQIEALRIKIQLKDRYNRVLKEELEESRLGATSVLQDLYQETNALRLKLVNALNSEKAAVQNALRSHRVFQLAMTDRVPGIAIAWLDDKLFDISKRLNTYVCTLSEKKVLLEEAEGMVKQIEKWPRPGTLPWEVDAIKNFHRVENLIERMKVKLETASILNGRYSDVNYILRDERGKYNPALAALETQVEILQKELKSLQKMLDDAVYFRDEAVKNLALTEKEAIENRRRRRKQMAKMKKAVQKVLEANNNQTANPVALPKKYMESVEYTQSQTDFIETIRLKRQEVEKFQDRARRIVEVMRVPNLTFIPARYKNVMDLGERLKQEQYSKEELRDLLLHQRDHLQLILCHFSFTGHKIERDFDKRVSRLEEDRATVNTEVDELQKTLQEYGDLIVTLRLGALSILDKLDEGKRRHRMKPDFTSTMKLICTKTKRLMDEVESLESLFDQPPVKNFGSYVKPAAIPPRLVRVGTPAVENDSEDEEIIDLKIPGRQDIKAKSLRIIAQGRLKRGLR